MDFKVFINSKGDKNFRLFWLLQLIFKLFLKIHFHYNFRRKGQNYHGKYLKSLNCVYCIYIHDTVIKILHLTSSQSNSENMILVITNTIDVNTAF